MKVTETYTSLTATHVKFDLYTPNLILRHKGIIQIHHGLCEYSDRYQKFAEYLCHEGYIVVVSDFPGHGTSLNNFEQGYFGNGKATNTLVEDMHRLRRILVKRFPELSFFVIGVGFGSLVVRKYLSTYGEYVDGAVLIGTCMKKESYYQALSLVKLSTLLHGDMYRSPVLKKTLDTYMQKGIKGNFKTDDQEEWDKYIDDPMTDFIYTNRAYHDILDYIQYTSLLENIKKIPNYTSILLLSGTKDNFSHHGKDTKKLYDILKSLSFQDVEYKIYDKKQDLLHEINKREIYKDILHWLLERTYV
ncbi:MAG: alpha/beta fold hydrolase [Faecalibacillus sp.]